MFHTLTSGLSKERRIVLASHRKRRISHETNFVLNFLEIYVNKWLVYILNDFYSRYNAMVLFFFSFFIKKNIFVLF